MKILGIDTSTGTESVAIASGSSIIAEVKNSKISRPSSQVISLIDSALQQSGCTLNDIDGIAVAIGPGSFTGLRIGIATGKGLALSLNKPLVPVSSLMAILRSYSLDGNIATIIDAKRDEVYGCLFNSKKGFIKQITTEFVMSIDDFCKQVYKKTIFIGEDVVNFKEKIKNILGSTASFYTGEPKQTTAAGVALLGKNSIEGDAKKYYTNIIPNYIRRSEAEMKMKVN